MADPRTTRISEAAGFTLVELLVSIAVIAILAAILVPAGTRMVNRAKETKCLSNVRSLTAATITYAADNGGQTPETMNLAAQAYHGSYYRTASAFFGFGLLLKGEYLSNYRVIYCPVRDVNETTNPGISVKSFQPVDKPGNNGACSYVMTYPKKIFGNGTAFAVVTEYYFYGSFNYAWNHANRDEFVVGYSDGSVLLIKDPAKTVRNGDAYPGMGPFDNWFTPARLLGEIPHG